MTSCELRQWPEPHASLAYFENIALPWTAPQRAEICGLGWHAIKISVPWGQIVRLNYEMVT